MNGSSNLSEKLFEHYLKMADSEIRDLGIDNEVGNLIIVLDFNKLCI